MSSSSYVFTLDSLSFFLRPYAKCLDYILTFASGFFARCFLSAVQFSKYDRVSVCHARGDAFGIVRARRPDLRFASQIVTNPENDTVKEELTIFRPLSSRGLFPIDRLSCAIPGRYLRYRPGSAPGSSICFADRDDHRPGIKLELPFSLAP